MGRRRLVAAGLVTGAVTGFIAGFVRPRGPWEEPIVDPIHAELDAAASPPPEPVVLDVRVAAGAVRQA